MAPPVEACDPASPAIEVEKLHCAYGDVTVLQNVSFSVARGEIFFIIGSSGCGKSTLLRNLVGLTPPAAGKVKFFGRAFTGATSADRRDQLKNFGMAFQSGALWSSLTIRQNVALPLEEYTLLPRREVDQIAAMRLAQVGLNGFEDHYPAEISGGMKKRAA